MDSPTTNNLTTSSVGGYDPNEVRTPTIREPHHLKLHQVIVTEDSATRDTSTSSALGDLTQLEYVLR